MAQQILPTPTRHFGTMLVISLLEIELFPVPSSNVSSLLSSNVIYNML